MIYLVFTPIAVLAFAALCVAVISLLVEVGERRRLAVYPKRLPRRLAFRPILLQGGKPERQASALPVNAAEAVDNTDEVVARKSSGRGRGA